HSIPNDPGFSMQWNMQQVNAPNAWEINSGAAQGVIVAVLDTGFTDYTGTLGVRLPLPPAGRTFGVFPVPFSPDPDFDSSHVMQGAEFTVTGPWIVASTGQKLLFDGEGHGTHVAGTIAQRTNNGVGFVGLANGATLLPVKVCISDPDVLMAWGRDLTIPV